MLLIAAIKQKRLVKHELPLSALPLALGIYNHIILIEHICIPLDTERS